MLKLKLNLQVGIISYKIAHVIHPQLLAAVHKALCKLSTAITAGLSSAKQKIRFTKRVMG